MRSQPRIEQYAVADPVIAVVTSDAAGAATLTVGPLDGSEPSQTLADYSDISQLKSSGRSGLLGFVLTPLSDRDLGGDAQLHVYDPAAAKLTTVSGFDGKPLEPLDWTFVPGTTFIVAQTARPWSGTPSVGCSPRWLGYSGHPRRQEGLGRGSKITTAVSDDRRAA